MVFYAVLLHFPGSFFSNLQIDVIELDLTEKGRVADFKQSGGLGAVTAGGF